MMSDHLSGPRALADPACDICDVFAFPSPERPGHLVLVTTVFPLAGPTALFSDAVLARFRLRPVTIAGTRSEARFAVGGKEQEVVFDVTFDEPEQQSGGDLLVQRGRCITPDGETIPVTVGERGGSSGAGIRVFAGLVSDPFIFEGVAIFETLKTGQMAFPEHGINPLDGANVLGLVVEVDCARWLGGGPLLGVVAETLSAGVKPMRLERVGRPEAKNLAMSFSTYDTVNSDIDIRDLYNSEDAFALADDYTRAYRARLNANLAFFDGLDGKIDWPAGKNGNHPLTDLWLDDFLVVDVAKPFAENGYFEIEQAMLDGREHLTCGGRALNEDCMDTYYTLVINAGNGPRIRDGVDQAAVPCTSVFPYLAPPNLPKPA